MIIDASEIVEVLNQKPEGKIISIIGAGGKTTLMYQLAEAYAEKKQKVLVTTTTHIYRPNNNSFVENLEQLYNKWDQNTYAVVGTETKGNKLKALRKSTLEGYMKESEVVLIEADGANGFPCKVSNTTEPVVVDETNVLIMVLGLDTIGKRMRNVCFRCELAMDLLGEDREHVMNEDDLVAIIRNQFEEGLDVANKTCIVVLNKCDNKKRENSGKYIVKKLEQDGKYRVLLTSFL